MDRNIRAKIIYRAEAIERHTKGAGRAAGAFGQSGLAVLRCLLFRFGSHPEPSYEAIQRGTKFCLGTISKAIKSLESWGIACVMRRSVRTAMGYRKITNAYRFPAPTPQHPSLPLIHGEQRKPIEIKQDYKVWDELPDDNPLKRALAKLGTAIGATTKRKIA